MDENLEIVWLFICRNLEFVRFDVVKNLESVIL